MSDSEVPDHSYSPAPVFDGENGVPCDYTGEVSNITLSDEFNGSGVYIQSSTAEPEEAEPPEAPMRPCCGLFVTCERACVPRGRWLANVATLKHSRRETLPEGYEVQRSEYAMQLRYLGLNTSFVFADARDKPIADFLNALLTRIEKNEAWAASLSENLPPNLID